MIWNSNSNTSLSSVLKKLQDTANTPFEKAHPIPAEANHSVEFYKHEHDKVFSNEWICIGREDEIPNAGDYLTHDIAGVSVFVVRQSTKEILGFVNACAHRFTCLLSNTIGNSKLITCPYHAWTYNLDGTLKSAPFMKMKEGFNLNDHRLRKLQTEVWEGFIYMTLNENPNRSVNASLKDLKTKIVGRYDMAKYKTVMRESMVWNANWKNLIENFIESYHVPIAHQKTFAKHKKPIEDYVCGDDNYSYCYHYAPQKTESGLGAAHLNNTKLKGIWRRTMVDFCVFPNHLITLMPDYLWYISVQPLSIGQFRATWGLAFPPENLADIPEKDFKDWLSGMRDYMNIANDEDRLVVEGLYRGTSSSNLPQGTFHPIERNLWQFIKYLSQVTNCKI
jgi:phenylpropionate dioxygenase-like ring-hydroxylating dioxygenase large terminal subunit